MKTYLAPAVSIALIMALVVSFIYFRRYSPYRVAPGLVGNPETVLSISDVEMVGRSGGRRAWSFKAKHVDVARGQVRTVFREVHDGKIYEAGKVVAEIAAGSAVYESWSGDIEAADGIEVSSPEGYRVEAASARWSAYFRKLTCPGKITLKTNASSLTGRDLVADMKQGDVTFQDGEMKISIPEIEKLGAKDQEKTQ